MTPSGKTRCTYGHFDGPTDFILEVTSRPHSHYKQHKNGVRTMTTEICLHLYDTGVIDGTDAISSHSGHSSAFFPPSFLSPPSELMRSPQQNLVLCLGPQKGVSVMKIPIRAILVHVAA